MLPFVCNSLVSATSSSLSPLAEAAVGKLLHAIGDSADKQVAAQPRRVTSIQPQPFGTELLCGQICQRCDFSS